LKNGASTPEFVQQDTVNVANALDSIGEAQKRTSDASTR